MNENLAIARGRKTYRSDVLIFERIKLKLHEGTGRKLTDPDVMRVILSVADGMECISLVSGLQETEWSK